MAGMATSFFYARLKCRPFTALPCRGWSIRGALITDLVYNGRPLRVIAAHLGLWAGSRAAQTKLLMALLADMDDRPGLLMGDLNKWRGVGGAALWHLGPHFQGSVALPSYPARYPLASLDRMMVSAPAILSDGAVHDTPSVRRTFDHLPLKARLDLP